jgi:hypothetical protein
MALYCDAEARYRNMRVRICPTNCASKALQNGSVGSRIHVLGLGKKFTVLQTHCNLFLTGLNETFLSGGDDGIFHQYVLDQLMLFVAFDTFLWSFYTFSSRTLCKYIAISTHPFLVTEGKRPLHCRSSH